MVTFDEIFDEIWIFLDLEFDETQSFSQNEA